MSVANNITFENLVIYFDNLLDEPTSAQIRGVDASYQPNTSYSDNKTVVSYADKIVFQCNVLLAKCDVIVPVDAVTFRDKVLAGFLSYFTSTVRSITTDSDVANNLDIGINFYVPMTSQQANLNWWGKIAKDLGWKNMGTCTTTALGAQLSTSFVRIGMNVRYDKNFTYISAQPATNSIFSRPANPLGSGFGTQFGQTQPQLQPQTQPRPGFGQPLTGFGQPPAQPQLQPQAQPQTGFGTQFGQSQLQPQVQTQPQTGFGTQFGQSQLQPQLQPQTQTGFGQPQSQFRPQTGFGTQFGQPQTQQQTRFTTRLGQPQTNQTYGR